MLGVLVAAVLVTGASLGQASSATPAAGASASAVLPPLAEPIDMNAEALAVGCTHMTDWYL